VVLDACVLHPAPLRDLLIRLDLAGMVRARWSERIMEECFASIIARRPDLAPDALDRTRELMKAAIERNRFAVEFQGLLYPPAQCQPVRPLPWGICPR
jgi:hypothetical protein